MYRLLEAFDYHEPGSIPEAVALLTLYGDRARVLAGGTDLVISMKKRDCAPEHVVAIGQLGELDFLEWNEETGLHLGPLVTHARIARSPLVRERFPMLAVACNEVGTPQVRNMGTIGGNVCKAGPSQDTPPVLVALDAQLRLVGPSGERIVAMGEFCTGPFCTVLLPDELLVEITVPPMAPRSAGRYKWVTKITQTDETLVGVAAVLTLDEDETCRDVRIAMGSVAPLAVRAWNAEEVLRGRRLSVDLVRQAADAAAAEARPRSRADYRRRMVGVLVADAVTEVWQELAGEGKGVAL
jgi:aerobic carbon-monoxide dehydrogenase medium subunit